MIYKEVVDFLREEVAFFFSWSFWHFWQSLFSILSIHLTWWQLEQCRF